MPSCSAHRSRLAKRCAGAHPSSSSTSRSGGRPTSPSAPSRSAPDPSARQAAAPRRGRAARSRPADRRLNAVSIAQLVALSGEGLDHYARLPRLVQSAPPNVRLPGHIAAVTRPRGAAGTAPDRASADDGCVVDRAWAREHGSAGNERGRIKGKMIAQLFEVTRQRRVSRSTTAGGHSSWRQPAPCSAVPTAPDGLVNARTRTAAAALRSSPPAKGQVDPITVASSSGSSRTCTTVPVPGTASSSRRVRQY